MTDVLDQPPVAQAVEPLAQDGPDELVELGGVVVGGAVDAVDGDPLVLDHGGDGLEDAADEHLELDALAAVPERLQDVVVVGAQALEHEDADGLGPAGGGDAGDGAKVGGRGLVRVHEELEAGAHELGAEQVVGGGVLAGDLAEQGGRELAELVLLAHGVGAVLAADLAAEDARQNGSGDGVGVRVEVELGVGDEGGRELHGLAQGEDVVEAVGDLVGDEVDEVGDQLVQARVVADGLEGGVAEAHDLLVRVVVEDSVLDLFEVEDELLRDDVLHGGAEGDARGVDELLKVDLLVLDVEQRLAGTQTGLAVSQRTRRIVPVERFDVEGLEGGADVIDGQGGAAGGAHEAQGLDEDLADAVFDILGQAAQGVVVEVGDADRLGDVFDVVWVPEQLWRVLCRHRACRGVFSFFFFFFSFSLLLGEFLMRRKGGSDARGLVLVSTVTLVEVEEQDERG
ncbi:hypothetical protein CTA1_8874 [Colletotrichum tanaceti]|uniref:Uncharacterized protein n=1 Tax=Colletotrichum tanaceti TaxID=1306861 RepID=A0A4U6X8L4_9PEZI|nr:hypothetical protein CTA1_8874 [Colletotrichum tanaceti]